MSFLPHIRSENTFTETIWQTQLSFFPRRAFKRQCTEDGSWLEGACEPVTCEPPPPIFHGSYSCTDGFRFDSVCRLNCTDPAGNTASTAVTGGSAHTVRLLHAPCKQVCPSSPSLSFYSSFSCLYVCVCVLVFFESAVSYVLSPLLADVLPLHLYRKK